MENKQTAVEWLLEQCPRIETIAAVNIIEEAKAMEQLELYAAYETGWVNGDLKKAPRFGSEYYDQTYNKGAE